jgi:hypothetical protein
MALVAAVGALLGPVPSASASYPGRAGAIALQRSSTYEIENDNGVVSSTFSLLAVRPPSSQVSRPVSCQGSDVTFGGDGEQFCAISAPSFSPGGQMLAFSGVRYEPDGSATPTQTGHGCPDACQALVLAQADGTNPRLLSVALVDATQPAFLRDRRTLVFAGANQSGVALNLFTVRTDGSGLRQLTTNGAHEPAPCANGSIVYVHANDLYVRTANGRTRRLTRSGGAWPDCSQDSRTIAFVRGSALYTIEATGQRLRRLTPRNAKPAACVDPGSRATVCVEGRPAFSPAGGMLAVSTVRRCTSQCGEHFRCNPLTERLELIDLLGRLHRTYVVGHNDCQPDFGLADDTLSGVGWQPLPG